MVTRIHNIFKKKTFILQYDGPVFRAFSTVVKKIGPVVSEIHFTTHFRKQTDTEQCLHIYSESLCIKSCYTKQNTIIYCI